MNVFNVHDKLVFNGKIFSVVKIERDPVAQKIWYLIAGTMSLDRLPGHFVENNFKLADKMDRLMYE